ncbi:MAG: hypothetical protein R3Y05_02500 [bacterium]
MKKLIIVLLMLVLTGCSKEVSAETFMEGLLKYNTNLESYYANVSLEMTKGEELVKFDCEVYYLKDDYYKVIMLDNQTNNTQAIVKNQEGVFVLTPLLNKQFKFTSDWPLNSSHAYLFQSLIQDISNDEDRTIIKEGNDFVVTSKYDCKTNASLKTQKVTFSSEYRPLYCMVMNDANDTLIKATYNDFVEGYSLKPESFDTQTITTSLRLEMGEGNLYVDVNDVEPTYAPVDTTLETTTASDDNVRYNYSGSYNYTIVCQEVMEDETLTTQRIYDELLVLSCGIASLNDTTLTFYKGNVQVTIYFNDLELEEVVKIANSF